MTSSFAQPYFNQGNNFMIACDQNNMVLQLINIDPTWHIDYVSSTGIDNPNHVYDPATGELTILGTNLTGPKSYGSYTFDIVGASFQFQVYIISCCQQIDFDRIFTSTNTSTLNGLIVNETVLVLDEIVVDAPTNIDHSDIYFGADAKLEVQLFQDLTINTSSLKPFCDFAWNGVFAQNAGTYIEFNNSLIEGSAQGFNLREDVTFSSTFSTFLNNFISLGVFDFTQNNGPFLNSTYINLSDNNFEINDIFIGLASGSTIDMTSYTNQNPPINAGSQGVLIYSSSSNVRFGFGQSGNATNSFSSSEVDDVIGIYVDEGLARISNNTFTDLALGIAGKNARLNIGGTSLAWGNEFISAPIQTNNSSHHIRHGFFTGYSPTTIISPTNQAVGGIDGTRAALNNYSISCPFIVYGDFSTVNVVFDNNNVNETKVDIRDSHSSSLNLGVKVTNNFFYSNTTDYNYSLYLNNTNGVRVADNTFRLAFSVGSIPVPIFGNHAMRLENVSNAQIKQNTFEYHDRAIYGTGDLQNTIISCNHFYKGLIGFYLQNVLISDQGSSAEGVDNVWTDAPFNILGVLEARMYLENVNNLNPWNYNYTWGPISIMDPMGGVGTIINGGANLNPNPSASATIADCGVLNKKGAPVNEFVNATDITEFVVYPNPTADKITIEVPATGGEVRLLNLMGQVLMLQVLNTKQTTLELDLPAGIYVLAYYHAGETTTKYISVH